VARRCPEHADLPHPPADDTRAAQTLVRVCVPAIQVLPASATNLSFDPHQFYKDVKAVNPVDFDSDSNPHSKTGLSYDDARRMQRIQHKLAPGRQLPVPSWATNLREQAELVTVFWENKISVQQRLAGGTLKERLEHAHRVLLASVPGLLTSLTALCREFVATTDAERKRTLTREIQILDTRIVCIRRGPALTCAIIWNYYCRGSNSVQVSQEVSRGLSVVKPILCRQILHRLHVLWQRLEVQKMDSKNAVPQRADC